MHRILIFLAVSDAPPFEKWKIMIVIQVFFMVFYYELIYIKIANKIKREKMNIQKIFNAVDEDDMSSPLITVCNELIKQGYDVKVEGVNIESLNSDSKLFEDLEYSTNKFEIVLLKNSLPEQKFKLVFTDYHEFGFQKMN